MTTGANLKPSNTEFREWAADQLGVATQADRPELRGAFLRRLRDEEFIPPRTTQTAWRMLSAAAPPDEEAMLLRSDRVRAEIDGFVAEFFDLPVLQRKQRWHALMTQADGLPARTARLQALAPGLNIERGLLPLNHAERILAEEAFKQFVLPPSERAARRQAWLHERASDIQSWHEAAQRFKEGCPDLTELAPDFVHHLASWKHRQQQRERNRIRVTATPVASMAKQRQQKESNRSSAWIVWIVIGMLSAATRAGSCSSSRSTPSYERPFPKFDMPVTTTNQPPAPQYQPSYPTSPILNERFRSAMEEARQRADQRSQSQPSYIPQPPDPTPRMPQPGAPTTRFRSNVPKPPDPTPRAPQPGSRSTGSPGGVNRPAGTPYGRP